MATSRTKFWLRATTSALALCAASGAAMADSFVYVGGWQSFTAPATGTYEFTVVGAQGATYSGEITNSGGLGGRLVADFNLTGGQVINLAVGGAGSSYGGGGGSFAVSGGTPLAISGGGGGATWNTGGVGGNAGGLGPVGGGGAGGGTYGGSAGGGGGGFTGPGGNGVWLGYGVEATGGEGYNGLGGGNPGGGFGGGGGGVVYSGGGGGGATGGDGGYWNGGGGGGSYYNPSGTLRSFGLNYNGGNGYINITEVPEPATLGLFGLSLAGLSLLRRRRKG